MAQMNLEQFETLWAGAQKQPALRQAAAQAIKADLSLTGMLTQYLAMAAKFRNTGKISQADYNDLAAAIAALNPILTRINDKELVAESMQPAKS